MGLLEPAAKHAEELCAILGKLAKEEESSLDVAKECAYLRRKDDPASSYWAVLNDVHTVVGYLSGGRRRHLNGETLPDGQFCAFVQWVIIDAPQRGQGYARRAIAEFAEIACGPAASTLVSLRLDTKGDVETRRCRFTKMPVDADGFQFRSVWLFYAWGVVGAR